MGGYVGGEQVASGERAGDAFLLQVKIYRITITTFAVQTKDSRPSYPEPTIIAE
jgi:hypothetical protein